MKQVLVILPYANSHLELFIKYIQRNYVADFYIHRNASYYRKNITNNEIDLPSLGYFKTIKKLIGHKYDIVFTHGIFYPYLMFLQLANQNKIIVLSEGFKQNFNKGIIGLLKRIHLRSISKRNTLSVFMLGGKKIKKQYDTLTSDKIRYFNYGMYPDLNSFRNVKSANKAPIKFVYAGQFITRKNIQLMLDAISITPQFQTGEAEFTFIGEGPQEEAIRSTPYTKLIKTLSKELLFKTLSQSDILVLVSSYEGWGAIVNEACACGCVLILNKEIGASSMFFEDTVNGYCTDTTPQSLSHVFARIIKNHETLHTMKEASFHIFKQQYQNHDKLLFDNITGAIQ